MVRVVAWWRRKPGRVRFAAMLLAVSVLGWPLSALTFARDEPPTVLGLSWLAITFTALDVLMTAQVHEKQDQSGDGADSGAEHG